MPGRGSEHFRYPKLKTKRSKLFIANDICGAERWRGRMCYFERTDYACGDWKWGNMKQQCPREWRTGETCGAKLSHDQHMHKNNEYCKICQDILVKKRRIKKEEENLARWKREPGKFRANIEKSEVERATLIRLVNDLERKRPRAAFSRRVGS